MTLKIDKKIAKTFVLQKHQSDCGIACLSSIIKFHGGNPNPENLRVKSGTTKQGTTLLGLYQASNESGFDSDGMQADLDYLKSSEHPVILHVVMNKILLHYVVCYRFENGNFLIGDPALGLKWMTEKELSEIWMSNKLLQLIPDSKRFVFHLAEQKSQWRWFKQLIANDISLLVTILVVGIVVALLSLATAVFSQVLIDKLIPAGDKIKIFVAIGLVTMLLILKSVIGYFRQLLMVKQGFDINVRITGSFLSNLLMLPYPFFTSRKIGDMIARLNDIGRIQQTITYLFGELLINILLVVVSLAAVLLYSGWVFFILLIALPLYFVIAYSFHKEILSGQKEFMIAHALNEGNYINTISNILPIKSFRKETLFAGKGETIFTFFQEKLYKLGKIGATVSLLTGLIGTLVIMLVITVSTSQMISDKMTTGVFLAVFSLSASILPSLATIAFTNVQLQGARVAFERMFEFSSLEKEFEPATEQLRKGLDVFEHIELKDICFRYPGRGLLLEDISFKIKKGELITIFGDNGTGKSTILYLLQRFYQPESGQILLNGMDINNFSIEAYRKFTSVVPQDVTLINGTVMDNIVMSDKEVDIFNAIEVMKETGLMNLLEKFPQGLYTVLGDGGVQISGGQKQIVGFARALVVKPELLLLDEVTSNMDRVNEEYIIQFIKELKRDTAILNITHNVRNASYSDNIIVLSNGKIEAFGKHQDLLKSTNQYSRAWQVFNPNLMS